MENDNSNSDLVIPNFHEPNRAPIIVRPIMIHDPITIHGGYGNNASIGLGIVFQYVNGIRDNIARLDNSLHTVNVSQELAHTAINQIHNLDVNPRNRLTM